MWKLAKSLGTGFVKGVLAVATFFAGASAATSVSPFKPGVEAGFPYNPGFPVAFAIPSNAIPSNAIPSNAIPSNALPAQAIPSNAIPSNALPAQAIPSNAIPSNAIPSNLLPFWAIPSNAIPSNAIPSNILANAKFQRRADRSGQELAGLAEQTCKGKSCAGAEYYVFGGLLVDSNGRVLAGSSNSIAGQELAGPPPAPPKGRTPVTATLTSVAPAAQSADRCELFDGLAMRVTYQDWQQGAPLMVVITIPGGVPGLEKKVPGDLGAWNYSLEIGDYDTADCQFQGYADKLFCSINVDPHYENTFPAMQLHVNECALPIYEGYAEVPAHAAAPGSANSGGGGTAESGGGGSSGGEVSCGPEPNPITSSWCSCNGLGFSTLDCSSGECGGYYPHCTGP